MESVVEDLSSVLAEMSEVEVVEIFVVLENGEVAVLVGTLDINGITSSMLEETCVVSDVGMSDESSALV